MGSCTAAGKPGTERIWRDANGNLLQNGDAMTVIKDLKVYGASSVLNGETKEQKYLSCRDRGDSRRGGRQRGALVSSQYQTVLYIPCIFPVIASLEAARQSIRIQGDSEMGWIATSRQVGTRDDESPSFFF
ncbi:MAG: hypothetical protein HGB06_02065 [Chlorobaculum sp.]|nr:hypothetical protein [Chlorobaculum sp.]